MAGMVMRRAEGRVNDAGTAGETIGAVVALKPLSLAKTRLATLPGPLRQDLVLAMLMDTLRVLTAQADTVVVTAEPGLEARLADHGLPVRVIEEAAPNGLNDALRLGADGLRGQGIDRILACVADLPALRPDSLRAVLAAARPHPRSFLADADGIGTTMLIANAVDLAPRFGPRSAEAHQSSGAVPLSDSDLGRTMPDARRDVDTEDDLAEIIGYGVGPASQVAIRALAKIA